MGVGGFKIKFWGPKFFFMIFWFISYGKISDWLNISNKVSLWPKDACKPQKYGDARSLDPFFGMKKVEKRNENN